MKFSSSSLSFKGALLATALISALSFNPARAQSQLGTIWVLDFENRNWTQTANTGVTLSQILGNSAAPYINSLVTPGNANSTLVSYCSAYHHVLSLDRPSGAASSIHPSEPNYLWQEAGTNFGRLDDNDPYGSGQSVATIQKYLSNNPTVTGENFTGLLQTAGISWKSYQEGIDMQTTTGTNGNAGGNITNTVAATGSWTVPLASFSGSNASYVNPYNGSNQWNFACKHDGSLFFSDTNGTPAGSTTANTSTSNPEVSHYAPLEQLQADLTNGTCAEYNLITPDQYNDMHTALSGGYTYPTTGVHYTSDLAQVAQGDNFLSIVIPRIMASSQFKNNGAIFIWIDETEPTGASADTNQNDFTHTLMEIVISPLAKGNAYVSTLNYTHSSDLATLQNIFGVRSAVTPTGYLNDAANLSNPSASGSPNQAQFLSDLFQPGVIPVSSVIPPTAEPAMPVGLLALMGVVILVVAARMLPAARLTRAAFSLFA